MCGRFSLSAEPDKVIKHFSITNGVVLKPRYNIAPSQMVPIVRKFGQLEFLSWGLRPHWLAGDRAGYINARAETIDEKPSFRESFRKRPCLVAADGFFEWEQLGKIKQPYYITLPEHKVFAFAGIWEGDTCAIITLSHRPVIVECTDYAQYLAENTKPDVRKSILLKEFPANFTIYPVSTTVNSTENDFASCIQSLQ